MRSILLLSLLANQSFSSTAFKEGVCKLVAGKGSVKITYTHPITRKKLQEPFIKYLNKGKPFSYCSGSVIGPKVILTAAHCYQGTINQNTQVKIIPIMRQVKKIIDGKEVVAPIEFCKNNPYWHTHSQCVAGKVRAIYETSYEDVQAHCFDKKGDFFITPLKEKKGWPNPMFSNTYSKKRFDMAILHSEKDLSHISPISYTDNENDLKNLVSDYNYRGIECKAYGFGPRIKGHPMGDMKEMIIPVERYKNFVISSSEKVVQGGDSGGPLICPLSNGKTKLVGVVSRGIEDLRENIKPEFSISHDVFATIAQNKGWVQIALNQNNNAHLRKDDFHDVALEYELKFIHNEIKEVKSCFKKNKHRLNSQTSPYTQKEVKKAIKTTEKKHKEITKLYKKQRSVFNRAFLRDVYRATTDLRLMCHQIDY